jgi:TetR/AcrR family transcriptional regulator
MEVSVVYEHILDLEHQGLLTRTFRRLDPQRQQVILQAVLDEAGERGPAAINVKRVAKRAGVSVGSLYQYFGSRQKLVNFAFALCVRFLTSSFDEYRTLLVNMPLRDALAAYLSGGIEWSNTQFGFAQFFGRAAYQGDPMLTEQVICPVATAMRQMVSDILSAAAARGEIRQDVDLPATARAINILLNGAIDSQLLPHINNYLQVSDNDISFERVLETILSLIQSGISLKQ